MSNAITFLQNYTADPGQYCDRPFFLGVGIYRPHIPYFSPARYWSELYQPDPYMLPYRKPYNDPANAFPPNGIVPGTSPDQVPSDYENLPYIGKVNANGQPDAPFNFFNDYPLSLVPTPVVEPGLSDSARKSIMTKSYQANSMIAYLASIRFADAQIGRLVDALESQPGLTENTIIVLISDHGYAFGEKLHWGKVALWDQVGRIPMVIIDPRKPGNRTTYRPVSLLDIFPTLLELTGTPEPKLTDGSRYLDGQSVAGLLDNPDMNRTKPVLVATELTGAYPDGYCYPMHSVFDQRFHYIRYITNGPTDGSACNLSGRRFQEELYEIGLKRDVDPNEFVNLAGDPEYQGIKDYLSQYLPGGALYNQQGGQVEILPENLDCILNLANDYTVRGKFTDPSGIAYLAAPPGYRFEWSSPAFYATQYGDSVVIGPATVDGAVLAGLVRLPLTLRAVDTATGIFYQTITQLNASSSNLPSSNFTVSEQGPGVAAVELVSTSGFASSRLWEFGDGLTSDELKPAPHRYSLPGTYTIRHSVLYGSDPANICFQRSDFSITVDSADFSAQPCPAPLYLFAPSIASNNANLTWGPAFGAERYEVRTRSVKIAGDTWLTGSKVENFILIPRLKPNQQYEYQVRSFCTTMATDTSEWSVPFLFRTPTCFPPVGLTVDDITTSGAQVSWQAHDENILVHEVLARRVGGGPLFRNQVVGASNTAITGLSPGTTYELAVRPRCPNATGGPGTAGALTEKRIFTTLTLRESEALALEQTIRLQPNPAADAVLIQLSGTGGRLRVLDAAGRAVFQRQAAETVEQINVRDWAEGFYLVEWQSANGIGFREKLIIQR